ncbi:MULTISPECIES: SpaA isopeptide-forming pilin-related protein [unclassified Enterococcus]|uniref:SpaA isopeptide-forming pilin-related protein n=1 Tax=unclassified Enterococcus TaxID=2608891 RepID=UPI001CE1E72D|nr:MULTISPECIES: SpaA isopeptide-forming pilin-related protein [unclassified Enterococcus]MCA5013830.1 VWA domain-containing protein [Enterococcus sp. S23]MCA5017080.1 VWA domain-containing protein [Enterococcus sp. S22(2020)]
MKKTQLRSATIFSMFLLMIMQLILPIQGIAQEIDNQETKIELNDVQIDPDNETNQVSAHLYLAKQVGDVSDQVISFSNDLVFPDNEAIPLTDKQNQTIGSAVLKNNTLQLTIASTYQGEFQLTVNAPAENILPDTYLSISSPDFSKKVLLPTTTALENEQLPLEPQADLPLPYALFPQPETIDFSYNTDASGNYLTNNDQGQSGINTLNYAYGQTSEADFDDENYVNYNNEAYVKKTVKEVTGKQGLFDVTLDVKGNEYPNPIDLVLVIDYSSTMNGQKLENTIDGVEEFLEQIDHALVADKVHVGIVAYNRDAYVQPLTNNTEELIDFLEDTSKSHSGTFIQKGLIAAKDLLDNSTTPNVQKKIIVHIGDGSANRAYFPAENATEYTNDGQITPYNGFKAATYYRDFATDSPLYYTSSTSTVEGDPDNATLTSAKEIANLTLGTAVDLKLNNYDLYSIGVAPSDRGEYVDKNIASSEAKYVPIDEDLAELGDALGTVATKVDRTIMNGTIQDPMGEQIILQKSGPEFSSADYSLKSYRKVSTGVWVDAPNLLDKVAVSENDGQLTLSGLYLGTDERLTFTYQIRIDTESSAFIPEHWYLANGRTTLDPISTNNLLDFPIPSVKAPGTKVLIEKNWLDNNDSLGLRPNAISFVLKRTTVTGNSWQESQPILLSPSKQDADQWQTELDSIIPKNETSAVALAAFNNRGEDFNYSATEVAVDPNYTGASEIKDGKIVLTNTLNNTMDLTFKKVDEQDQPLKGVRFKLLDNQGQQIGDIQTSDENGQVSFTQLREGNYQLVEIEPLAGYQPIEPIQLTIEPNSHGELIVTSPENWTYRVVNKKITDTTTSSSENKPTTENKPTSTGQIPKAGERVQSWLLIIGVILISITGILYYKNKRSQP